jgi:hypothetical protein
MAKWDAALYSEKLLKRSSLDRMWTPVKLNDGTTAPYGFGWMLGERRGHRVVQHGGEWQGFSTHISRFVDKKLTVIVLTNLSGVSTGTLASGVAGLCDPELAPVERTAIRVDPQIVDRYVGTYDLVPGYGFTIYREGDKLWEQATGQPREELLAESETTFFLKGLEATFTLAKDASGTVTHLVLHQNGADIEVKKVK